MALSVEAIIAIIGIFITLPPTVIIVWAVMRRKNHVTSRLQTTDEIIHWCPYRRRQESRASKLSLQYQTQGWRKGYHVLIPLNAGGWYLATRRRALRIELKESSKISGKRKSGLIN